MASVNIPFNLDNKENGGQVCPPEQIVNFYSYQDPNSGMMPETKIENEQREQELCFKKCLLALIIALSSITLLKSCAINSYKLSRNLALNFQLKNYKKNLTKQKLEIESKIQAHKSFRGMKKVIKEEIKALDANEILVRFEK